MVAFLSSNAFADEFADDIYDGDYSLENMIQNYSVVTLGQNERYPDADYLQNYNKGDLYLAHSVGGILAKNDIYIGRLDNKRSTAEGVKYHSYFGGDQKRNIFDFNAVKNGYLYAKDVHNIGNLSYNNCEYLNRQYGLYPWCTVIGTYMNFNRLYNNITQSQKRIKKGKKLDVSSDTLKIKTGGTYYIDDISDVRDIIFEDFENNKDELTIITINNSGAITFPQLFRNDSYAIIPTNDYSSMSSPDYRYSSLFVANTYYGNIIWNLPNARYIRFRTGTPVVGHVIAPNADVEGATSTHFAGTFIVNSLYWNAGFTEAHFYPLTKEISYKNNIDKLTAKPKINKAQGEINFENGVNPEQLEEGMVAKFQLKCNCTLKSLKIVDSLGNIVEYTQIGENEYEFEMPASDVTIIPTTIDCAEETTDKQQKADDEKVDNPKTVDTLNQLVLAIIFPITIVMIGRYLYKRETQKIS